MIWRRPSWDGCCALFVLMSCGAQAFLFPTVDNGTMPRTPPADLSWWNSVNHGVMVPADAYPLLGENLTMLCHLNRSKLAPMHQHLNASHLRFVPDDSYVDGTRDWSAPGVQTTVAGDDYTLRLWLTNVTYTDTCKVYCKLDTGDPKGQLKYITSGTIEVGEMPEIGNMTCVSRNHEDLNCSFCPDVYPPPQYTMYFIEYSLNREGPYLAAGDKCYLYINPLFIGQHYFIRWTVSNQNTRMRNILVSFNESIYPNAIVKADPVSELTMTLVDSRVLEGSFKKPKGAEHLDFDYTVYVTTEDPGREEHTLNLGSNETFRVEGLHPYTEYRVSVINRVLESPYFSEPAEVEQSTLPDAPVSGPPIPPGAFRIGNPCIEDMCHEGHFFWGELPPLSWNGPLDGYNVTLYQAGRAVARQDVDAGVSSYTYDRLLDGDVYTFCVTAYNHRQHGNEEEEEEEKLYSPGSCIKRAPVSGGQRVPNAVVFAEKLDDVIMLDLSAPADRPDVRNMTVFACEPIDLSRSACKDYVLSDVIPANTTLYNVTHRDNYMYSVSANTDSASSGMTDEWICYYSYNKRAGEVEGLAVTAAGERSLDVTWRPQECTMPDQDGRLTDYVINCSCQTGEDQNVRVPGNASSYEFLGLQPHTTCNVSMEAVAGGGAGPRAMQEQSTKESRPGTPPQNVTVANVTSHDLLLTFEPSLEPNGFVFQYDVEVTNGSNMKILHTNELSLRVSALTAYQNLSISVSAVNSAGSSELSQQVFAQTRIAAPAMIPKTDIEARKTAGDPRILSVSWKAPDPPNGPMEQYKVTITGLSSETPPLVVYTAGDVLATDVEYPCESGEAQVNVTVQASNVDEDNNTLLGEASAEQTVADVCAANSNISLVIGISIASVILVLIIVGIWWGCRKVKEKMLLIVEVPPHFKEKEGVDNPSYEIGSGYPLHDTKISMTSQSSTDSGNSGSLTSSQKSSPGQIRADRSDNNGYGSDVSAGTGDYPLAINPPPCTETAGLVNITPQEANSGETHVIVISDVAMNGSGGEQREQTICASNETSCASNDSYCAGTDNIPKGEPAKLVDDSGSTLNSCSAGEGSIDPCSTVAALAVAAPAVCHGSKGYAAGKMEEEAQTVESGESLSDSAPIDPYTLAAMNVESEGMSSSTAGQAADQTTSASDNSVEESDDGYNDAREVNPIPRGEPAAVVDDSGNSDYAGEVIKMDKLDVGFVGETMRSIPMTAV